MEHPERSRRGNFHLRWGSLKIIKVRQNSNITFGIEFSVEHAVPALTTQEPVQTDGSDNELDTVHPETEEIQRQIMVHQDICAAEDMRYVLVTRYFPGMTSSMRGWLTDHQILHLTSNWFATPMEESVFLSSLA